MTQQKFVKVLATLTFIMLGWSATSRAASLTLAWDAPTDSTITGFRVFYGTQSGVYTNQLDAGLNTSVQISNLTDGASYYLIVKSYNAAGTLSAPSNEVASGVLTASVSIMCPVLNVTSPDGNPVSVTYSGLTTSGGTAPIVTSCAPASGSLFPVGTTSYSCTATDQLGQTASCTSTVTVTASTQSTPSSPVAISCPAIPTVTANNGRFANVSYSAPSTSGGVAPVTTSCTPPSGSKFNVGSTTVTCTATDAVQQQASCTTTATVKTR